jgi:hypothetical protein
MEGFLLDWIPTFKTIFRVNDFGFDASGHLNRAPATALSAGIDQVKRAWPAWLPVLVCIGPAYWTGIPDSH